MEVDVSDHARYMHICNALCGDGVHAGVVYGIDELTWEEAVAIYAMGGNQALSLEPAPEADPFSPSGNGPYPYRYLVRWRQRDE